MPLSHATDIYDQEIKSVYLNMIKLYAVNLNSDDVEEEVFFLTESGVPAQANENYFNLINGQYKRVHIAEGTPIPENTYRQAGAYFNDAGDVLFGTSGNVQDARLYRHAAFQVNEPDRTSVNEETGSLSIVGVPSEYIEMLQNDYYKLYLSVALVKHTEIDALYGQYIQEPISYEIRSATVDSASASINVSLKGGALLGYYASKYSYNTANYPGLNC